MGKKNKPMETAMLKEIKEVVNNGDFDDQQLASLAVLASNTEYLPRSKEVTAELLEVNLRLRQALNEYDNLVLPFISKTKEHLKAIRDSRMGVVPEVAQMMNALRDVRKFFLDKDYKEEMARLKEFVELCERLEKLKDSGFLDSVADTLLKLEQVKP